MLKRILVVIFVMIIFTPNIANSFNVISYDFRKIMLKYGYPDKVYKVKPIIEKEMNAYGMNLRAFKAKIGKTPDNFLDQQTFEAWQKWKKFKKEAYYRDNHPYSTPDQGYVRTICKPLNMKPNQKQFILELESFDNEIIIAFNLREYPDFAKCGVIIGGYCDSNNISHFNLSPLKGLNGYYTVKISLPHNRKFHFHLVKFGTDYQVFTNLPFMISYKDLMKQRIITKKIGRKLYEEKCQVITRNNGKVQFLK